MDNRYEVVILKGSPKRATLVMDNGGLGLFLSDARSRKELEKLYDPKKDIRIFPFPTFFEGEKLNNIRTKEVT